ncbi:response regulator [Patescibacteria group bacterium]|nr:MAG: response regulator [Patescibacteria group bacterium]
MTKILLVEDDKSLREIYGVRLIAEGYEIISAGDGEEALAMAIKERPTLIVSDVMMPKISGFDMLDILRSTTETKDVKVIMMTALSSDDQRARGEALGADRYLVKSQVGIEDVVRTVHDVLGDGVATPKTATQVFGGPIAPSAVASPAPSEPAATPTPTAAASTPAPMPAATPAPTTPEPAMPTPSTAPTPSVAPIINTPPEPASTPAPATPSPFQSPPNVLPQPTAPFSSNRPGALGDRVIHPLNDQPAPLDMASLMSQELSGAASAPVAPPPPPPAPDPLTPQTPPTPQV